MKKRIALLPVLLILGLTSLVYTGCKDDEDTTPPVVTLNGDQNLTLFLGTTFIDLGATATDDEDGTLGVTVAGAVNKDLVGVYTLTYSATDAAGNTGSAFRVVTVVNQLTSDPREGTYDCVITDDNGATVDTYTETLSISTTKNNALEWSKFGNYPNANAKLNIVINGNNIEPFSQTIVCGSTPVARTFAGSGTVSGNTIIINYSETVNGASLNYVHTYTLQ